MVTWDDMVFFPTKKFHTTPYHPEQDSQPCNSCFLAQFTPQAPNLMYTLENMAAVSLYFVVPVKYFFTDACINISHTHKINVFILLSLTFLSRQFQFHHAQN
jgi:hypothetical protein